MALNSAQSVFNLIRIKGSKMYQDTVPALTDKDPIGNVAGPILTQPDVFKEFSTLLGALIRTEVLKRSWKNPLSELIKTTGNPLGEYSLEVTSNPVTPRKYDPTHPELVLEYAMLDDKIAYYSRNVKSVFSVSIAREDMEGAFNSYDKFNDYVSMKISALESGQQISMYNHIMEAIVANYNAGLFVESDVAFDSYTASTLNANSESALNGRIMTYDVAIKNAVEEFKFPSTKFNNYGKLAGANGSFRAWTNPDDIYILATIDFKNNIDVRYLATVFNLEYAELAKRIITVPAFAYDLYDDDGTYLNTVSTDIQCMVCDKNMFKLTSELEVDDTFYNPSTLVTNYYKHWWATYAISPFANCLVFTTSGKGVEVTYDNLKVQNGFPSKFVATNGTSADIQIVESVSEYDILDSDGNEIEKATLPQESTTLTDATDVATALAEELASHVTVTYGTPDAMTITGKLNSETATGGHTDTVAVDGQLEADITRDNKTNYISAREVTIGDYTYTIEAEGIENFIEKYGNDAYISTDVSFVSGTGTAAQTYTQTVFVGLRNKAIING